MANKIKKHEHFNEVPKFLTTDVTGGCTIYKLEYEIREMSYIEACYISVKIVRYDGSSEALIEDPKKAEAILLNLRTGSLLPETHDGVDLTWYEKGTDEEDEISLEDILVMSSI